MMYCRGMQENPAASELLDRLLRSVAALPDPIERARQCVLIGDELRGIQSGLADIRRQAIYEATLRPGATGKSVAEQLGVSAKTVSLASSEFRREDLALMHRLVEATAAVAADSAGVAHAEAMIASSAAIGVLAHVVEQLSDEWMKAASTDDDSGAWEKIYDGFERARYLSNLAGLQRPRRPTSGDAEDASVPVELRWLSRVLNAMPGVHGWATEQDTQNGRDWGLWWSIDSSDPNLDISGVGPSNEGWLVSEWLVWLVRDHRLAGDQIESSVTAPPPMINEPGAMMTFYITARLDGADAVDPNEFARSIIKTWDGDSGIPGTGYFDIDWPEEPA